MSLAGVNDNNDLSILGKLPTEVRISIYLEFLLDGTVPIETVDSDSNIVIDRGFNLVVDNRGKPGPV